MALPFWFKKTCVRAGIARFLPAAKRLTEGEPRFARYVSDRVLAAPLDELLDPGTFPRSHGPELVDLNLGSPDADAVPTLRPSRAAEAPGSFGSVQFREAIAEQHRLDGRAIDPDRQILVTHGASGAYASLLDAFVNPGERVVLFDPCSPLFHLGAKSRRARLRWVPTWNEDGRTRFLTAGLTRALLGAKLLVLAQPAHPTGGRFSAQDLEEIAWLANRQDVLVCVEESLARFQYDAPLPHLTTFPGMDSRRMTIHSLSIGYGQSDLRIGWISGHRQLIRMVALCANLNAPGVSPIAQQAAAAALLRDRAGFEPILQQFRDRRRYAFDRLKGMGFEPGWPSGGFTMWVSTAPFGLDGRTFAERLLREERVLVGPGFAYGPSGGDFVRISFATEMGRLREGLSRLARFAATLGNTEATVTPPATADRPVPSEALPVFSRV